MKPKHNITTPHDVTFRKFLKFPEIARDFMEIHLPKELRSFCDLSTLKLENASFVEENLRHSFSDVLYIPQIIRVACRRQVQSGDEHSKHCDSADLTQATSKQLEV